MKLKPLVWKQSGHTNHNFWETELGIETVYISHNHYPADPKDMFPKAKDSWTVRYLMDNGDTSNCLRSEDNPKTLEDCQAIAERWLGERAMEHLKNFADMIQGFTGYTTSDKY